MSGDAYVPYAPLQTIKDFAKDVWIVDGPEIEMRYLGLDIPFPTRMTVVRLPGRELPGTLPDRLERWIGCRDRQAWLSFPPDRTQHASLLVLVRLATTVSSGAHVWPARFGRYGALPDLD